MNISVKQKQITNIENMGEWVGGECGLWEGRIRSLELADAN